MVSTANFFELAQLAEASYAEFDKYGPIDALGRKGLALTQAADLLDNWQLVTGAHRPNTDSGYSSTLFQDRHDPTKYVLAFRGTEPSNWGDITTDIGDIMADGIALDQIVDLYNEWQRISKDDYHAAYLETLTAETAAYLLAKAGKVVPGFDMTADAYLAYLRGRNDVIIDEPSGQVRTIRFETTTSTGLGLNIAPGQLTVTGHSLGGHLAVAFTRLFPEMGAEALTVNGAGFATGEISIPGLGLSATTNIRNLFGMLGGASGFDSGMILNIYGDRYPEIVTDNGELGLYQQGPHLPIHIEHVSPLDAAFGHGGQGMTDSLAVYDLFIEIDGSLQADDAGSVLARLKPLFEAGSNDDSRIEVAGDRPNRTLENLVNALADLFQTGVKIGDTQTDQREALYAAIHAIRSNSNYQLAVQANAFVTVEPLNGLGRDDIVARAQTGDADGLAFRYAITRLNPFAITGDAALYSGLNANGELDLYDPATGHGQLTEEYVKDRAQMLTWLMKYNAADQSYGTDWNTHEVNGNWDYLDLALGENDQPFQLSIDGRGLTFADHQIVFGSEKDELLVGGEAEDHLFGGDGNDILSGGGGSDYLEGGFGFDTYFVDGSDRIFDIDGQAKVFRTDKQVTGGSGFSIISAAFADWYESEDHELAYTYDEQANAESGVRRWAFVMAPERRTAISYLRITAGR